jgi:hypothetical protein
MALILYNRTQSPQSINFLDGSCVIIERQKSFELDNYKVYPEELERIQKFFDVRKAEPKQEVRTVRKSRATRKTGGNK